MATLDEMIRLGYKPAQSKTEQIASLLSGVTQEAQKQEQKQAKDVEDQTKLYMTLREAGYSPEDAHAKVTRTYRSSDFVQNLLGGDANVLSPPTGEDKVGIEQRKEKAGIDKTIAETTLAKSKSKYYDEGGPKRSVIDKMTPNQLQSRLKYLNDQLNLAEAGSEEEQNMKAEMQYVNEKIQKISGFQDNQATTPATSKKTKYSVGQTVYYKGKPVKIKGINQDGTYVI